MSPRVQPRLRPLRPRQRKPELYRSHPVPPSPRPPLPPRHSLRRLLPHLLTLRASQPPSPPLFLLPSARRLHQPQHDQTIHLWPKSRENGIYFRARRSRFPSLSKIQTAILSTYKRFAYRRVPKSTSTRACCGGPRRVSTSVPSWPASKPVSVPPWPTARCGKASFSSDHSRRAGSLPASQNPDATYRSGHSMYRAAVAQRNPPPHKQSCLVLPGQECSSAATWSKVSEFYTIVLDFVSSTLARWGLPCD